MTSINSKTEIKENDPQSLEQAKRVAKRHPIDLAEIKNWSIEEGMQKKFDFFKNQLMNE